MRTIKNLWGYLLTTLVILVLLAVPINGQSTGSRLIYLADGLGNKITSVAAGSNRPVDVILNDTAGTRYSPYTEITTDYDTGAGTQNLALHGFALPASGGAVAGGTSTNPLRVDPTGTTTQPVSLSSGSNLVGFFTPMASATTTNSAVECNLQSAATTNATNCKASSGNLYGYEVVNTTSTLYYLRLYNLGSAPTCSSATGFIRSIPIPHATGTGAGIIRSNDIPVGYTTGIGFCLTLNGASTDNNAAAIGVYINLLYK